MLQTAAMATGSLCTGAGGLGIAYQGAGIGYLGQCALLLVAGVTIIGAALLAAARSRARWFPTAPPERLASELLVGPGRPNATLASHPAASPTVLIVMVPRPEPVIEVAALLA